jgi:hypothetical protein
MNVCMSDNSCNAFCLCDTKRVWCVCWCVLVTTGVAYHCCMAANIFMVESVVCPSITLHQLVPHPVGTRLDKKPCTCGSLWCGWCIISLTAVQDCWGWCGILGYPHVYHNHQLVRWDLTAAMPTR